MNKKYYLIIIGLIFGASVYTANAFGAAGVFIRFAGSDTVYKAYQTAQQFFDDGGAKDFSNVQVIGQEQTFGSVAASNEYNATTTAANNYDGAQIVSPMKIKTGRGSLGSVIVLKAGTAGGRYNLYNATTSNYLLRTGQVASSTILITSLPTDLAAGTYTFDVAFSNGLLVDWTGAIGTSTITYR